MRARAASSAHPREGACVCLSGWQGGAELAETKDQEGLSQPLSQCKHVLIEIRSSGYNSFADVAARPPLAHPPPPSPLASTSVLAPTPPPLRLPPTLGPGIVTPETGKFDKFHGVSLVSRFSSIGYGYSRFYRMVKIVWG